MKINSIRVKNFKSISELSLERLKALNLFLGKNNSGKTNILESVLYFSASSYPDRRFGARDQKADIDVSVELSKRQAKELGYRSTTLTLSHKSGGQRVCAVGSQACDKETIAAFLDRHIKHINTSRILLPCTANVETLSGAVSFDDARKRFHELATQHKGAYAKLQRAMKQFFPGMTFQMTEAMLNELERQHKDVSDIALREKTHGDDVKLSRVGSGYLQLFVLSIFAFHPQYGVLMIDEPENHLHPALQRKLVNLFRYVAREKQVFVSTHSPTFVQPELLPNVFRVVRDNERGTHLFPSTKTKKRVPVSRLVQELNLESSEMLFTDKIILVEGEADKILMRGLIRKFYNGSKEVKVIATHSNTNFKVYRDLLKHFGVEYMIMTDRDSLRGGVDVIIEIIGKRGYGKRRKIPHDIFKRLHDAHIYVLPNGALEQNYPRKYRRDTKPLSALAAARGVTRREYQSSKMQHLRFIIEQL